MRLERWRLRSKITLALAAVTTLSVASTGYYSARQSYAAMSLQAEEEALEVATALAAPVNELLTRTRSTIGRLSRHPDVASMHPPRQRRVLELMTGALDLLDSIVVSDSRGRVLLATGEALLPSRPEALLAAPAADGKAAFSNAFRSSTGAICVAIGAPIRRGGKTVGVLSGVVALERHSVGGMKGIRFGRSGYAYLIDESGQTLSHPDPKRLLENVSDYRPPPKLDKTARIHVWRNTQGEERIAALSPIADSGWYVVVSRPRREADAPARRLRLLLAGILAAGLAGSIVVGAILARWITSPVAKLMRGVHDLSAGHIATRIEPGTGDEIGQLTSAFNDMAASLTRTIRHLEAFGYSVAHDLRAPARSVTILSELILGKAAGLDEESRRNLRRILDAGRRMRQMLDGLMTLSRLSQETPVMQAVDLTAVARACAADLSARAREVRADIEVAEGMTVRGDPRLLRILLRHLLDNALKFSGGRDGLRVEVGRLERAGLPPAYYVRDNGAGFEPALAGRIFKPFHRLPNAGSVPGIGIGLAAAARVVEFHGGSIWAEAGREAGATFYFTLGGSRER